MKKLRALGLAGMTCLATDAALAANPAPETVAEVAIYTVKDPDNYPALLKAAMEHVKKMPGLQGGVHMRSLKDPSMFADVYLWDSLAQAEAAAKAVETEPEFKEFANSFIELKVFSHFAPDGNLEDLKKFMANGAAVEMAVYSVKDPELQKEPRENVYRDLSSQSSVYSGIPLSPLKEGDAYIDFIAWTSPEEAEKTAGSMMAKEEHKAFFGNTDQVNMFEFFTIYDSAGMVEE